MKSRFVTDKSEIHIDTKMWIMLSMLQNCSMLKEVGIETFRHTFEWFFFLMSTTAIKFKVICRDILQFKMDLLMYARLSSPQPPPRFQTKLCSFSSPFEIIEICVDACSIYAHWYALACNGVGTKTLNTSHFLPVYASQSTYK